MAQYAGQMLPTGTEGTDAAPWHPADGSSMKSYRQANEYHARVGWAGGMAGIYRTRLPNAPGWSVRLEDDPNAPDLPPDTPTAANPPTGVPSYVSIDPPGDQVAGPVGVTGEVRPSDPVEAAPLIGGVEGTFVPMAVAGAAYSGTVTMVAGAGVQIRARLVGQSWNHADSAPFNVT